MSKRERLSLSLTGSLPLLGLYLCHMVTLLSTGQVLVYRLPVSFHKKIGWRSLRDKTKGVLHTPLPERIQDAPLCGWDGAAFYLHHTLYRVSPILTP